MILHPAIIALVLVSFLVCGMVLYSSFFGVRVIARWDLAAGSEEQLVLERKTYLVSTMIAYVLVFQIASLFLYIYTADGLHRLFVGAMCAAGTLNANPYGYPTFILKIVNFILAGLWLIVNHADNLGYDYPLIKKKYAMLLAFAPLILMETVAQTFYFANLKADVITSCCGSLFGITGESIGSDLASVPPKVAMAGFYFSLLLTGAAGIRDFIRKQSSFLLPFASGLFFLVSCMAIVSFISLYFYELPTHHCPFCLLQREYGYIGYLLYAALLTSAVSGLGVGLLKPFGEIASLKGSLPMVERRLTVTCLAGAVIFSAMAILRIICTDFTLQLF